MCPLTANADGRHYVLLVLQLLARALVHIELTTAQHVVQQALQIKTGSAQYQYTGRLIAYN